MGEADLPPVVDRAMATFNDHEVDAHMESFAEGAEFSDPVLDDPVSGTAHREYLLEVLRAFPDIRQDVRAVHSAADPVVLESTFTGTHEGPLEGVPPTGETATVPLVSVIEVSEEGITSWRDVWDQVTFREQLGLTFPAILGHLPRFVRWKLAGGR